MPSNNDWHSKNTHLLSKSVLLRMNPFSNKSLKNYNIVEFNTKANALDDGSLASIRNSINATSYGELVNNPIIIINDAMQFSAGVNLNYVMELAKGMYPSGTHSFMIQMNQFPRWGNFRTQQKFVK